MLEFTVDDLPKNVEPTALGKKKIPVVSWVIAGKWAETGESFHEEEAIEWIERAFTLLEKIDIQ